MPQIKREVIKDRARRLREKGQAALRCHLEAQVGAMRQVLVESAELGRTEHFTRARLAAPMQPGMILDVTVAGHDGRQLLTA
jgi:threonylcarbamoyladenosine tRNA methylthiotransferase MtaB